MPTTGRGREANPLSHGGLPRVQQSRERPFLGEAHVILVLLPLVELDRPP